VLAALIFAALQAAGDSNGSPEPSPLAFEFRYAREGEPRLRFQPLGRTSLLYGRVAIRARPREASDHQVARISVRTDLVAFDGHVRSCSAVEGEECVLDLGPWVGRRTLSIDAIVGHRTVSSRVVTFDAHPSSAVGSTPGALVEAVESHDAPPDIVRRLVQVEQGPGYRDDLGARDFRASASGLKGARVLAVEPPRRDRKRLIPVLIQVGEFVRASDANERSTWNLDFEPCMSWLVDGLRRAAKNGVDASYLVVPYAATGRAYGPFRFHPGSPGLEDARRDDETERAVRGFLLQPPLPGWAARRNDRPVSDLGSVIHTLNDLYLREYDGVVEMLLLTDDWANPSHAPRLQPDLLPRRSGTRTPWTRERTEALLARLDEGQGAYDAALARFVADGPSEAGEIAAFLRRLDPGGTQTLQPHRLDTSPMLSVILVPGPGLPREMRRMEFLEDVRALYGGETWDIDDIASERGRAKLVDVLSRIHDRLVHAYLVELEVPNPQQNGARHDIRITTTHRGARTRYVPYYTSSLPVRRRLPGYLASPFEGLRLLAAYEVRNRPFDEELVAAAEDQWRNERSTSVRSVLFESRIALNLKRLQAGPRRGASRQAREDLRALAQDPARFPDPRLAQDAARVAEWYATDHADEFR
jgi:hypothetical protein